MEDTSRPAIDVREYLRPDGSSPYAEWFDSLDSKAAAKVTVAKTRMSEGNLSNVKSVGGGVHECRIDFGPGYRIYFGRDGQKLLILLGGGTKKRQQDDIDNALELWNEYKKRKKKETENATDKRL
jgi:putative addiction module killer protein